MYKSILKEIKEFDGGIRPRKILMDYEQSFIQAAQEIFPEAYSNGCNFYFN